MKRADMTCINCIKFYSELDSFHPVAECRLDPAPLTFVGSARDPRTHWCSQGEWQEWSETYQEFLPFLWGEWEDEKPK